MRGQFLPLALVRPNREVSLMAVIGGQGLRRRLNDMGLSKGVKFKVIHASVVGPCIISLGNSRLVVGRGMAQKILVKEE